MPHPECRSIYVMAGQRYSGRAVYREGIQPVPDAKRGSSNKIYSYEFCRLCPAHSVKRSTLYLLSEIRNVYGHLTYVVDSTTY